MKIAWPDKPRNSRTAKLPYCYKVSPTDLLIAVPVPEIVQYVDEALDLLDKGHSTRKVADWLKL